MPRTKVRRTMLGPLELLRESLPLRELLAQYKSYREVHPGQEWHDRVMQLGTLEPPEISKMHGVLLANGWVDTRVAIETFNTPGRLQSCYKITPDGVRALQWAMQEADWSPDEENGWN